jgi:hypothetical protein
METYSEEVLASITGVMKDYIRLERKYHRQESKSIDGVEVGRIVRETLETIAKKYNIDLATLREEHQPIIVALNRDLTCKVFAAEDSAYDRGRIQAETKHYSLSGRKFGLIEREEEAFDRARIFCIIDATVRLGGKLPRTNDTNKINAVQANLQFCNSYEEVAVLLDDYRVLICESFGIDDESFTTCLKDIYPQYVARKPMLQLVS